MPANCSPMESMHSYCTSQMMNRTLFEVKQMKNWKIENEIEVEIDGMAKWDLLFFSCNKRISVSFSASLLSNIFRCVCKSLTFRCAECTSSKYRSLSCFASAMNRSSCWFLSMFVILAAFWRIACSSNWRCSLSSLQKKKKKRNRINFSKNKKNIFNSKLVPHHLMIFVGHLPFGVAVGAAATSIGLFGQFVFVVE